MGYGTVEHRRAATAQELESFDLSLLVTSAQDIYHARMRIMRRVRLLARDRPALLADVKRTFAACSCNNGFAAFSATSPSELREQVIALADTISADLLALIRKYSSSVNKGSHLRSALNVVAARLTVQQLGAVGSDGGS